MIEYKKTLISSAITALNGAKQTGALCLRDVYLYNIISRYLTDCNKSTTCSLSESTIKQLESLLRALQNKNKEICNIRIKTSNSFFKFKNKNINNFFGEMATFNLNINGSTNLPPNEVGDGARTTLYNTTIVFTKEDFTTNTTPPYSDPEGDVAALLKILSLPAEGEIQLNGTAVAINDVINFTDIEAGLLTFIPDSGTLTDRLAAFTFAIADSGSLNFTS